MLLQPAARPQAISYAFGTRQRTLAEKSTPSAAVGVAGLRGLNDGLVPAPAAAGGRGGAGGGRGAGAAPPAFTGPIFTWSGSRGPTQWVQYTFPDRQEVSRGRGLLDRAAAVVARALSGRRRVEAGRRRKAPTARAERVHDRRVRAGHDDGDADRSDDGAGRDRRRSRNGASGRTRRSCRRPTSAPTRRSRSTATRSSGRSTLANESGRPLEIGDLAVPFNFAERTGARGDIYTRKLLRHSFVAGHGSWIYWQRSNGEGPYLVMTPMGQTKFEFQTSTAARRPARSRRTCTRRRRQRRGGAAGGNWRLPVSSLTLAPKGPRDRARPTRSASSWATRLRRRARRARHARASSTPPSCPAWSCRPICRRCSRCARRTRSPRSSRASGGDDGSRPVATKAADTKVYRVQFSRLGENTAAHQVRRTAQWSTLEFFVTEPLETVIQKRAAFLASTHQHKDPIEVVRRRLQRLGSEERDPAQPGRSRQPLGLADRRQ